MQSKRKKQVSAVFAAVLVVVIALTGTYAWRSISQTALNEAASGGNPGGRLHDDFNGSNKDIYVENFGDIPIFARIQLREYMETGKDAGINKDDPNRDATPVLAGTDINDISTWTVHTPGDPHASFHSEYWKWTLGGETVFMPTFNKNKDSLAADINGTFAGPDGDPATDNDRYGDYVNYTLGEQKTGSAVYDADADEEDEGEAAVEGVDIETREETHAAKATQNATVLSMAEWKAQGAPRGKYWVYDTDGWAYWAEAIQPGEATGMLLDGIELQKNLTDWYYAIKVTAQFATADDLGSKTDSDGFFQEGMTDDALLLLSGISGNPAVTVRADGDAKIGKTVQFHAVVGAFGEEAADQSVTWAVSGSTSADTVIDTNGLLTVGADETIDGTLTITATATGGAPYTGQIGTMQVKVGQMTLDTITPGSTDTVTIDGIEWYCLVKDDGKALIWAKEPIEKRQFNSSPNNTWRDSTLKTYLNGEWLDGTTMLKEKAIETDITTRSQYNATDWITTQDKVFLLSEADLFGTFYKTATSDARDYTYGNSTLVQNEMVRRFSVKDGITYCWLRSPAYSTTYVTPFYYSGNFENYNVGNVTGTTGGVRPALWVSLAS